MYSLIEIKYNFDRYKLKKLANGKTSPPEKEVLLLLYVHHIHELDFNDAFERCFGNNSQKLGNFNARVSIILNVDVK